MFYDTIETASQDDEVEVINTRLWELYTNDCQHRGLTPSLKDYLVWVEEEYQS